MAEAVTWDGLRELAAFRAERGCAISLYVDLDPRVSPTAVDARTRVHSLLDEGGKANGAELSRLTHDQRQGLKVDLERTRRYFDGEFSRDGVRGVAVFCAGLDGLWRPLPLAEPVSDRMRIGAELSLAPLVPAAGRGEGALVAVVGRERGELYRLRGGRLESVADRSEEQPGRHDQGGWSQARFERHIDELARHHLREVAGLLDRSLRRERIPVVIVCTDDNRAELSELLSNETRSAVVGWAQAEAHAGAAELAELVLPVVEEWRAGREAEAVERWREEAGRRGRAASGWEATLEAASDGRVELLLYHAAAERAVWRCPACGRLALLGGKCPLDGFGREPRADGLDLAVRAAISHGGTALAVRRADLDPAEGIGALLRY